MATPLLFTALPEGFGRTLPAEVAQMLATDGVLGMRVRTVGITEDGHFHPHSHTPGVEVCLRDPNGAPVWTNAPADIRQADATIPGLLYAAFALGQSFATACASDRLHLPSGAEPDDQSDEDDGEDFTTLLSFFEGGYVIETQNPNADKSQILREVLQSVQQSLGMGLHFHDAELDVGAKPAPPSIAAPLPQHPSGHQILALEERCAHIFAQWKAANPGHAGAFCPPKRAAIHAAIAKERI